jgi:hypothetical protein
LGVVEVDLNVGMEEAQVLYGCVVMDDHWKQEKGTSGDDGVVAARWRLDSRQGVRGAVDASVRPVDTEKAYCCGS